MKKLYLLMAVVLICGTTMAQVAQKAPKQAACFNKSAKAVNLSQKNTRDGETAVWSCDFEDASAYSVISPDNTGSRWQVTSEATYPEVLAYGNGFLMWPMNYSQGTDPYQISETPGNWMILDLIGEHYCNGADCWGDGVWGPIESSVVFADIDLSTCVAPKFTMMQSYRAFNPTWDKKTIETSIDGGATWTAHEINVGTWANGTYVDGLIEVLLPEVASREHVTIRVRYENVKSSANTYAAQYGWQFDDCKIVEAPSHNLSINAGRMSMFGYIDYRNVPAEYWTNLTDSAKRAYAYQIYDPFAQTPRQNWVTSSGYGSFNVEITNNGAIAVIPSVNIKVTSPSGATIYDQTVTGASLASTGIDTLDFATIGETMEESNIFYFDVENESEIELGRYTITYYVYEEGAEDSNIEDNTLTQYFDITDNNYSKCYSTPTTSTTLNGYTISASGDEYGTRFTYYYEPEQIMSADVYIDGHTTLGTSLQVVLYEIDDEGEFVQSRTSDIFEVTEEMLDTWTNFEFENEYYLHFEEQYQYKQVVLTVKAMWDNESDKFYLGASDVLTNIGHESYEYFSEYDGGSWFYGSDDVAVALHEGVGAIVEVEANENEAISMYPNPSNGIVNFTNVENATIEVYNMMGQVVATVNNANANASIDLSNVANGNYVVRIVKDGATSTSKLNIVR